MAVSCENPFKNFSLDSGDPAKLNEKLISGIQDDIATNVKELKEQAYEAFVKIEKPYVVDATSEKNTRDKVETSFPESALTVSVESSDVKNILPADKSTIKPYDIIPAIWIGQDLLKESGENETGKIIKQVRFNSEAEIFRFMPELSIIENYNFVEDVTLENTGGSIDVNNAGDSRWTMKHLYWKEQPCETSIEKEIKPIAVDVTVKKNSYENIDTRIPESIVTVSSESSDVENVLPSEKCTTEPSITIPTTLAGKDLLKESGSNKTAKIIKQVRFNSEVETFTFVPGLSIMENYNFVKDVTPENSFASIDVNNTVSSSGRMNHLYWKSENNLSISSSCSQYPIHRKRFRHNLRVSKLYSRLIDEDIDNARQTDFLPRSRSVYYPERAIENRDEDKTSSAKSCNLSSRLSKTVEKLKKNTKAFMNKILTKVKKRKEETSPLYDIPEERAGAIAEVADKDLKDRPKIKRNSSIFTWKKKDEDGNNSACAMPEKLDEWLPKSEGNSKADSKSFMDICKKFVKKK